MQKFVEVLKEARTKLEEVEKDEDYRKAVCIYIGLWITNVSARLTTVGRWNLTGEKLETPFSAQILPFKWDYAEVNPLNEVTGGALGQVKWMTRVLARESPFVRLVPAKVLLGDGAKLPRGAASTDVVVTDPPYFDAISYADLSDFFYVWLKRSIADLLPETFSTPLTPKNDEATALKHRHGGDGDMAEQHFVSKLAACFAEAKRTCRPNGIIVVMFAHQTSEAWTALVRALFEAGLNITATFPIDTELKNRTRGLDSSALESSITVICRPREVGAAASFKDVRREIQAVVRESVHRFWDYGFRGGGLDCGLLRPGGGRLR